MRLVGSTHRERFLSQVCISTAGDAQETFRNKRNLSNGAGTVASFSAAMSQIESGARHLLASPTAYDLFQTLVGARRARLRWIRDYLKPFPGSRILDIGCGTAEVLALLPEGVDYTGFDSSPAYIDAARRRYGDRGSFTCERVSVIGAQGAQAEASPRDLTLPWPLAFCIILVMRKGATLLEMRGWR